MENTQTHAMQTLKMMLIEELETTFDYLIHEENDAATYAEEILDIYHKLTLMQYMGSRSEAWYLNFALEAWHHSIGSSRGAAFLYNLERQYKAFRCTFKLGMA